MNSGTSQTAHAQPQMADQKEANDYYFLDKWFIPAPIEKVWEKISDSSSYPEWWSMAWECVEHIEGTPRGGLGETVNIVAKGILPYKVKLTLEVTRVEEPYLLGVNSHGDLNGTGLWQLRQIEGGTVVTYEWIVRADKAIIRDLSPVVKPIFEYNHHWVMRHGEEALRKLLAGS